MPNFAWSHSAYSTVLVKSRDIKSNVHVAWCGRESTVRPGQWLDVVTCAQETLSRWMCARCTTTTRSCDTRSPCWDTVSMATCWLTARGRGGWDQPDTTSRVYLHHVFRWWMRTMCDVYSISDQTNLERATAFSLTDRGDTDTPLPTREVKGRHGWKNICPD